MSDEDVWDTTEKRVAQEGIRRRGKFLKWFAIVWRRKRQVQSAFCISGKAALSRRRRRGSSSTNSSQGQRANQWGAARVCHGVQTSGGKARFEQTRDAENRLGGSWLTDSRSTFPWSTIWWCIRNTTSLNSTLSCTQSLSSACTICTRGPGANGRPHGSHSSAQSKLQSEEGRGSVVRWGRVTDRRTALTIEVERRIFQVLDRSYVQ